MLPEKYQPLTILPNLTLQPHPPPPQLSHSHTHIYTTKPMANHCFHVEETITGSKCMSAVNFQPKICQNTFSMRLFDIYSKPTLLPPKNYEIIQIDKFQSFKMQKTNQPALFHQNNNILTEGWLLFSKQHYLMLWLKKNQQKSTFWVKIDSNFENNKKNSLKCIICIKSHLVWWVWAEKSTPRPFFNFSHLYSTGLNPLLISDPNLFFVTTKVNQSSWLYLCNFPNKNSKKHQWTPLSSSHTTKTPPQRLVVWVRDKSLKEPPEFPLWRLRGAWIYTQILKIFQGKNHPLQTSFFKIIKATGMLLSEKNTKSSFPSVFYMCKRKKKCLLYLAFVLLIDPGSEQKK